IGPSSHVLSRPALLRVRAARAGTPVRVSRSGRRAVRPSRDQALERRLYAPSSVPPTVPERRAGLYHPYNAGRAAHRQGHPRHARPRAAADRGRAEPRPAGAVGPRERARGPDSVAQGGRAPAHHGGGRGRHGRPPASVRDPALGGRARGAGVRTRVRTRARAGAAERLGFPVFEVPYPVPFIAITEAVFTRLLAEQYEVLQRAVETEQVLTRAAMDGQGVEGIASALAAGIGGWALVLDLHGMPLAATSSAARQRAERVWEELRERRPLGTGFS